MSKPTKTKIFVLVEQTYEDFRNVNNSFLSSRLQRGHLAGEGLLAGGASSPERPLKRRTLYPRGDPFSLPRAELLPSGRHGKANFATLECTMALSPLQSRCDPSPGRPRSRPRGAETSPVGPLPRGHLAGEGRFQRGHLAGEGRLQRGRSRPRGQPTVRVSEMFENPRSWDPKILKNQSLFARATRSLNILLLFKFRNSSFRISYS